MSVDLDRLADLAEKLVAARAGHAVDVAAASGKKQVYVYTGEVGAAKSDLADASDPQTVLALVRAVRAAQKLVSECASGGDGINAFERMATDLAAFGPDGEA